MHRFKLFMHMMLRSTKIITYSHGMVKELPSLMNSWKGWTIRSSTRKTILGLARRIMRWFS